MVQNERLKIISHEFDYSQKTKGNLGKFWFERYGYEYELYSRFAFNKYQKLKDYLKGGRSLLDIGTGFGDVLYLFQDKYSILHGIDPSKEMVELATYNIKARNVKNSTVDLGIAEDLNFENDFFDVVLLLDVFEHIRPEDIKPSLNEIRRVLNQNGQLIIVTPSKFKIKLWCYFDNLLIKIFKDRKQSITQLPSKNHTEIFYSRSQVVKILKNYNYQLTYFSWVSFYPAPERPGFFHAVWTRMRKNRICKIAIKGLFMLLELIPFFRQKMFLVFEPVNQG